MANELARFLDKPHDLTSALTEVVRLVVGLEERLGSLLFKDFLALHFSSTRPPNEEWVDHPVIVLVVAGDRAGARRGRGIPGSGRLQQRGVLLAGLVRLSGHHTPHDIDSRRHARQIRPYRRSRPGGPMTCRPRSAPSRSLVLNQPIRRTNHALGDLALCRRVGRHRADHLVLVLDVLEYRNILSGRLGATTGLNPQGNQRG